MEIDEEQHLAHYGILRESGRYPWGSGGTQEERNRTFLSTIDGLHDKGLSDTEIARGFGITTSQLRKTKSNARNAQKQNDINMAQRLKDKGYSNVAIGQRMGINESSVRALLKPGEKDKAEITDATAGMLKEAVSAKGYVDVGSGVERHLGISSTKLGNSIEKLTEEGYTLSYVKVEQLGTGQFTTIKVLSAPGTDYSEVYRNRDQIQQVLGYSEDGGRTYDSILPPLSVDSKRVDVRYAEQGGADADGVIYIRPGVKDVSLGGARYAQVRVAVDGTHYLKGMAIYKEGLPEGVDLQFNTNKSDTGNKLDALKPMKDDPNYPFGATIDHQIQEGEPGKKRVTSAMNVVNEEGDWEDWSKSLSSQMLSKQSPKLAKTQLDLTLERKKNELEELRGLDNPAVKKKLLEAYADDADSSAVHLKAAALPRQGSHVILPVNSMKETEVYAPTFRNGERVVLIRYPHGGIFEIPELTVNNNHPEATKLIGPEAKDAIGIHSKVAARLSGADFDGDTVLVIPNNNRAIKTAPALEGLKGFDPQRSYPHYDGMPKMSAKTKGLEMGKVSNLITDMTIQGAPPNEIVRAVRHSMVVIDAEKHNLDYKASAIANGIPALKEKYQGRKAGGAATLLSRGSSDIRVPERKTRVDPETGKKVHEYSGETYTKSNVSKRTGVTIERQIPKMQREKSTKLAETDDAHTLSSGQPIEKIYADHSNALKDLANTARKEAAATEGIRQSSEARVKYAEEVKTLEANLNLALRNSPLERQAQVIANANVTQKKNANPDLEPSEIKKLKAQELTKARNRTGAKKQRIEITADQWTAIQAGAISNSKLHQILNNADLDKVKKLATPKPKLLMTTAKQDRAVAMLRNGYTQAEVADALGVSVTTLKRSLKGGDE